MTKIIESGTSQKSNPTVSQEAAQSERFAERRRIPMSIPRRKLEVGEIPGYHLHWFNDYPGRIQQAQQAGYEFVDAGEVLLNNSSVASESGLDGNQDMGTRVSYVVGTTEQGKPLNAYLMKIREDWYQEDQKEGQKVNDRIDQQLRRGGFRPDGETKTDTQNVYVKNVSITR